MSVLKSTAVTVLVLISLMILIGCESDDNGDSEKDSGTETADPLVTAQISVPSDFGGQATDGLAVSFWREMPTDLQTLPEGIGAFGSSYILIEPPIDEFAPLDIEILPISLATREPIDGEFYINITLFVEGGGFSSQMPVVDVDFSHFITTKVQVGTEPVDLGDIELLKFQGLPAS